MQGCNLGDLPEVPCDIQESCTVADKTAPGVIEQLFGVRDSDYPYMFGSCIAGGMIGVNLNTDGGKIAREKVLVPAGDVIVCGFMSVCMYVCVCVRVCIYIYI